MKSEPQQVYVSGALTSASNKDIEIYETIEKVCAEAGYKAYLPHRDTGPRNIPLDPAEVFLKNSEAVQNSVAVIAEVSNPSIGVGMECEYSLRYRIPLIAVAQSKAQVSRMLQGHPLVVNLLRYEDNDDLRTHLLQRLKNELVLRSQRAGLFVAFEGMDGTGKSTLAKECAAYYSTHVPNRPILLISDPPSLKPWDEVKQLFEKETCLTAQSEAILLLAARVDQVNRQILPILQQKGIVFADRFHDSWLIYQGERLQRCVQNATLEQVDYFLSLASVAAKSLGGLVLPDHTFTLTGDPQILRQRLLNARGVVNDKYENQDFLTHVRNRYVSMYERSSARMTLIDVTRRSLEECKMMIIDYIDRLLI